MGGNSKSNNKSQVWDFPGGPVVKSSPSSAGNVGLIPGQGTKIAHAMKQLSPWATTREAQEPQEGSHIPQLRPDAAKKKKKFKGSQG